MIIAAIAKPANLRNRKTERGGFPCPSCGLHAVSVQVTRRKTVVATRRRRVCICGCRFSTTETVISESVTQISQPVDAHVSFGGRR